MGTCLVKKLNSVVDDNLPTLGGIRLTIHKADTNDGNPINSITLYTINEPITIKVFGDGYVNLDSNNFSSNLKTVEIPPEQYRRVFFSDGDYKALILNKYGIKFLTGTAATSGGSAQYFKRISIEFNDLKALFNLNESFSVMNTPSVGNIEVLRDMNPSEIWLRGSANLYGDISVFSKPSLTKLNLNSTNLVGDIGSLSSCSSLKTLDLGITDITDVNHIIPTFTSLTELTLSNQIFYAISEFAVLSSLNAISNVGTCTGTIEDFVNTRISAIGSSEGSFKVTGTINKITLGSTVIGGTANGGTVHFIHWNTANKIWIFNSNSTEAAASVVMCKGCTESEISAWQSAGKTVIQCN